MTKPNPQHRNTDSERTNVIPAVSNVPLGGKVEEQAPRPGAHYLVFLAVLVALGGLDAAFWISESPRPINVLVTALSVAVALVIAAGGIEFRRGKR